MRSRIDIGVLTVIPKELKWTLAAFGIPRERHEKTRQAGRVYRFGQIPSKPARRPYQVVVGCIGEAGTTECAVAATSLIHEYRPRLLILVGIAAGARGAIKIGNVVLSEQVWDYESAALVTGKGGKIEMVPRPHVPPLPYTIVQDITDYIGLTYTKDRIDDLFRNIRGSYPKLQSNPSSDIQERKKYERKKKEFESHVAMDPHVESAVLASGKKLLKNPRFLHQLQNSAHGRIKVGEMEAYGLATACYQERVDWLVVRGISDFGDKLKNDDFHDFAAQMAAITLRDFIGEGLHLVFPRARKRGAAAGIEEPQSPEELKDALPKPSETLVSGKSLTGPSGGRMLGLALPFDAVIYRFQSGKRSPLTASQTSNRWAPLDGGGILYFTTTKEGALAEIVGHLGPRSLPRQQLPGSLYSVHAKLAHVLDLTNAAVCKSLEIDQRELFAFSEAWPYARSVVGAARKAHCEAVLVRSMYREDIRVLILFDRIALGSQVELVAVEPSASLQWPAKTASP